MTFKTILPAAFMCFSVSCNSAVASFENSEKEKQSETKITKSTDEIGKEIVNVKSKRNEGYTVHPSSLFTKTTNEFYCKGFKVETLVLKRKENHEVRSIDLTLKSNGEKIDLKPIIGSKSNLYGYYNLDTQFACVDDIVRITINGQHRTEDNQLAPLGNILDFRIDRDTGQITSKKSHKK